jgi:hypothetical protein
MKENSELSHIRLQLSEIDKRLDTHSKYFEKNDQRFEKIDQRLDSEFRIVHTSINRLAADHYSKRIEDDQKFSELKSMFDAFMHRTNGIDQLQSIKDIVGDHERRIGTLEGF